MTALREARQIVSPTRRHLAPYPPSPWTLRDSPRGVLRWLTPATSAAPAMFCDMKLSDSPRGVGQLLAIAFVLLWLAVDLLVDF